MGMAASQARYLGLTARKTNTEYEGQQVNQARVALANDSAGLFNQLLTMEVPQAPSTADFTTVQYSYTDGLTAETIESMEQIMGDPIYNYQVKHFHYANVFKGQKALLTNPQVATEIINGASLFLRTISASNGLIVWTSYTATLTPCSSSFFAAFKAASTMLPVE